MMEETQVHERLKLGVTQASNVPWLGFGQQHQQLHLSAAAVQQSCNHAVVLACQVMHVLELVMPPPGCLAPGASATLKVTFRPQVSLHILIATLHHCMQCLTALLQATRRYYLLDSI